MEVDDNSKEEKVLVNSAIGSTRERSRPPTAEKTQVDLERLFREHSELVFRSATELPAEPMMLKTFFRPSFFD
jgi:hypothetical protein